MHREVRPVEQRGRDDRATAGGERSDERGLLAGDAGKRTDAFEVDRGDVRHDREVGTDDGGRDAEFSRDAHAGLDHGEAMEARFDAQEHQRDADEIVEVGFRDESFGTEERGEQFLCGGLADATGHTDDTSLELRAPAGGEAAERDERVVDDELRKVIGDGATHQGTSGAL